MTGLSCTGEPISWPRLEAFAARSADPDVERHLATCAACRRCCDQILADTIALRPLQVEAPTPRRMTVRWWAGPIIAAAAFVVVWLILRTGDRTEPPAQSDRVAVKGLGEVVIDVVRERAGTVREGVRTFESGDRFKIVLTCALEATATVDVTITDVRTARADHPLPSARIQCGNRIVLSGAFTIIGTQAHRVCAELEGPGGSSGSACLTLDPEQPSAPGAR